ncbi:unnamed protein product [Parascedosporium putredinis]|uniref:Uncharacterized protein n=1 Tax=Parascedosporium putredinis TaxID=1442378 RepID=A0A9P1H6C4_9PEZI|nr:unnamed protein product [Parascedosporium putredinis]CAI8000104.1 unnamed protein product [Parascedosporium putredinis]
MSTLFELAANPLIAKTNGASPPLMVPFAAHADVCCVAVGVMVDGQWGIAGSMVPSCWYMYWLWAWAADHTRLSWPDCIRSTFPMVNLKEAELAFVLFHGFVFVGAPRRI